MNSFKTSLKNFVEQGFKYSIVCLGSYLGNMLNDSSSFPVGKIERIEMFPLNFEEFLISNKCEHLIEKINNLIKHKIPINMNDHLFLNDLLHDFMIVGGMPKVVDLFLTNKYDELNFLKVKEDLILDYQQDIIKYTHLKSDKILSQVLYNSIPTFLAKQNKKVILSKIDKNARYLNYANAIEGLLTLLV